MTRFGRKLGVQVRAPRRSHQGSLLGGFVFFLSLASLVVGGLSLYFAYRWVEIEFPDVSQLKTQYALVKYRGRDLPPLVSLQKARPPGWVSLGAISRAAQGAVIVSEDWAFYQHHGYDAKQIREVVEEAVETGHFSRGASTITQQVVKNVFLSRDRTFWRKLKELILAYRIEDTVGKRKILETYFNVAEWGEGVFGISAAARHYFGKSPSELTGKEGAFLAMLLPSPKRYTVSFRKKALTRYAKSTVDSILGKMLQAGYLSDVDYQRATASPLPFERAAQEESLASPATPEADDTEMSENLEIGN